MSDFCVERLEEQIKELNGTENPPAQKVRRLTIDGFACFIQHTREEQEAFDKLNKRLDKIVNALWAIALGVIISVIAFLLTAVFPQIFKLIL